MSEHLSDHVELRPVEGLARFYAVAADGRVRALPRIVRLSDGRQRRTVGKWLKPLNDPAGYHKVTLYDGENKGWQVLVHRLIAAAWLEPGRPDQQHVNHKDRNRQNNAATNLEWCTVSENNTHSWVGRAQTKKARAAFAQNLQNKRAVSPINQEST